MSYDTIFQAAVKSVPPAAEDNERTVFDPAPARRGAPQRAVPPAHEEPRSASGSELLIDEPEPASDSQGRNPPRPKNRRGGGAGERSVSGMVKWLAVAALAGAAGFSLYYFVWPLVGGSNGNGARASAPATTTVPTAPPPSGSASAATTAPPTSDPTTPVPATPTSPATTTAANSDPRAGASATATRPQTSSVAPRAGAASPPAATPTSKPPDPVPKPSASGAPKPPATSLGTSGARASEGNGRALLQSGNLAGAARAFQREISSDNADKFTLALGLYCNEENAGRLVASASGSSDIYVLPTSVEGRSCYRVIWGLYDSREAAERGIPSLPMSVRAGDVAPVAVSRFLR